MNHFAARARHDGISWIGEYRCADHAKFQPVEGHKGTLRYPTREKAQMAADEALRRYMNGRLRRDGERVSTARLKAEKLFKAGRRPVEVEVR